VTNTQQAQLLFIQTMAREASNGNTRVFISDVYDYIVDGAQDEGTTLEQFKALVIALRPSLNLSRCDLVGAYSPFTVARSACLYMGAEFHFIGL